MKAISHLNPRTDAWFIYLMYVLEKTQSAKKKNNFGRKRGDRRHSKVTLKTKFDSFSVKAGLASFGSAGGGNSYFGTIQSNKYFFFVLWSVFFDNMCKNC